jgi:hypothetical protein
MSVLRAIGRWFQGVWDKLRGKKPAPPTPPPVVPLTPLERAIASPDNRHVNPGRKIIWWSADGKRVEQRDTGYWAGRFGDHPAYNIEAVLKMRWPQIADYYVQLSGDESIRAANGDTAAVTTEVRSRFRPARAQYEDGTACPDVPDDVWVEMWIATGHRFAFLTRNSRDHFGEGGTGAGYVFDPDNRMRATWSFNNAVVGGRRVSLR